MAKKIREIFKRLEDPRKKRGRRHLLGDFMMIALCAVICGADNWKAVSTFGRVKRKWFKSFLDLPHGIASHYTFDRVIAALKPDALERCFDEWVKAVAAAGKGVVAIDGKTFRRSLDKAGDKAAIHMVSAWASANDLVFAQLATEAKSNEITAIPKLLELLDLKGNTVTIDAWEHARKFCKKVGKRLPTEAEWEYAVRAGTRTKYYFGDDTLFLALNENYCDAHCDPEYKLKHAIDGFVSTGPVASYEANPFGLHDMAGNVTEWVADFFGEYKKGEQINPRGPKNGKMRVVRGGSFLDKPEALESDRRLSVPPETRKSYIGFRCAANKLPR